MMTLRGRWEEAAANTCAAWADVTDTGRTLIGVDEADLSRVLDRIDELEARWEQHEQEHWEAGP